jgi:hypothetical protein
MGLAIQAADRRRGKWDSFNQGNTIEFMMLAKTEPERPQAKYRVGEMVRTPQGLKRIDGLCFISGKGWHYRFYAVNCMYKEIEIEPVLSAGEIALMRDVAQIIRAAG